MNKATSENLKRFISTATDTYRRAYGRNAINYPRHCVIIGTTNEDTYLRDRTGNRRYWPVLVGEIDLQRFRADIDQLWAEACVRETKEESIALSRHLWKASEALQKDRMIEDAYAEKLYDSFATRTGKVSMESVKLLLNIDTSKMTATDSSRIKAAMASIDWEYSNYRLHDLAGNQSSARKGFANGTLEERKTELVAERLDGNVFTMIEFTKYAGDEPF